MHPIPLIIIFLSICRAFPRSPLHKLPPQKFNDDYDSDSRAVSENVDLDAVDGAAYDRIRNALHSIHARVGAAMFRH